MTVKELINKLSELNPNALVVVNAQDSKHNVDATVTQVCDITAETQEETVMIFATRD